MPAPPPPPCPPMCLHWWTIISQKPANQVAAAQSHCPGQCASTSCCAPPPAPALSPAFGPAPGPGYYMPQAPCAPGCGAPAGPACAPACAPPPMPACMPSCAPQGCCGPAPGPVAQVNMGAPYVGMGAAPSACQPSCAPACCMGKKH